MLQILLQLWLIGNRTSCRPIQSVIILVIKQIGLPLRGRPILLIGTLSTRTGEEDDAIPEVKSRISIAVRMRIGCIIPSCPRLRREVRSFDVVHSLFWWPWFCRLVKGIALVVLYCIVFTDLHAKNYFKISALGLFLTNC